MSAIRVFVTLPESELRPSDVGLGDAWLVNPNFGTWELAAGQGLLVQVFDLVSRKRLVSAYVSMGPIPEGKPWVAREWWGKIVTDIQVASEISSRFGDWKSDHLVEDRLVIFAPPYVEPREAARREYRDHLNDHARLFVEADLEDVWANPEEWFGEYAGPEAAGWVTLLSAAMVNAGSKRISLGNLAALGFRKDDGRDSLWRTVKSDIVSVKAIGFSRGDDWHERAGFRLPRGEFALDAFESSKTSYAVALEIDASIDPKVIIGSGTVFEQLSPGHAQNLSVAQEWHDTIEADQIVGVVLPAYCLNRNMSPPSGQPLRLTPLAFAGDFGDQQAVWRDIERRRGGASA